MVLFNSIVKVYDGNEEIKHIGNVSLKNWDGVSETNEIFKNLIVYALTGDGQNINTTIQSLNIFKIHAIKNKIIIFFDKIKKRKSSGKSFIPILFEGASKNKNIPINEEIIKRIEYFKNFIILYIERLKNNASIR